MPQAAQNSPGPIQLGGRPSAVLHFHSKLKRSKWKKVPISQQKELKHRLRLWLPNPLILTEIK